MSTTTVLFENRRQRSLYILYTAEYTPPEDK